jgi:hypothetical protein
MAMPARAPMERRLELLGVDENSVVFWRGWMVMRFGWERLLKMDCETEKLRRS